MEKTQKKDSSKYLFDYKSLSPFEHNVMRHPNQKAD